MSFHCEWFWCCHLSLPLLYVVLGCVPGTSGFIPHWRAVSPLSPAEQAVYNRPQPADRTRAKEGKDTVEAYQLAQRLQSMRTRRRRVRDPWGNWCDAKDLEGQTFEHLSAEELARRREEEKLKPAKSSKGSRQTKRYDLMYMMVKYRASRSETSALPSVRLECHKSLTHIVVWNNTYVFHMFHIGVHECFCIWWKPSSCGMRKSSKENVLVPPLPRRQWETWKVSWLSYIFREIFFHFIVPLIPFSWFRAACSLQKSRNPFRWKCLLKHF